jgi:hypothetical protein
LISSARPSRSRPRPPIEAYAKSRWLLFERLVVVQDRYPLLHAPGREPWLAATRAAASAAAAREAAAAAAAAAGGPAGAGAAAEPAAPAGDRRLWMGELKAGFSTPAAAAELRAAARARHGWPPPPPPAPRAAAAGGECAAGGGGGGDGGECAAGAAAAASEFALEAPSEIPRVVTVMLDHDGYPPVTNHRELVEKLEEVTGPMGFTVGNGAPRPGV